MPNALGFHRIIETDTNGYLVRQFLYNSLYDRLSTRPFLEDIEKKWLAFQLLCALRDCHAKDIYHGDIKTENTLVTSWNWLYLTDFSSSFKPVVLPDDNPSGFTKYFDTSGRRTCYLAPERFVAPGEERDRDARVTWAMDVFSAGCVMAELFLETPIFNLSQMYKYRRGEYDPVISHLSRIQDRELREMISHMIKLEPEKRYSAEQYLQFARDKVFPSYFYTFLHGYMELITHPSSTQYPSSGTARNIAEADERIDRVYEEFDKISNSLGHTQEKEATLETAVQAPRLGLGHFPVRLSIPNNEKYVSARAQPLADDGTLIFLTLIVSSLRNTARASSKIRACDILLAFSERLTDEAKLDRVLPYLMTLLNDKADMVVVTAIRTITQLLQLVRVVTAVNSHVFVEYILPRMQSALLGASYPDLPSPLVRATYASCLGSLATSASRFLELAASLAADGSISTADPEVEPRTDVSPATAGPLFDSEFDNARRQLVAIFESHTKMLIEDDDPFVRRAFLSAVPELCMFFGTAESNDIILTHLNTYLNDRDWMLKCAFFDTVIGIATFLGSTSLEQFTLPLMVQALTDPEEFVVQAVLHSLAELAALGLLSKPRLLEVYDLVVPFTMHPNIWIRESAAEFLSAGAKYLSLADVRCLVLPIIGPFLKPDIIPEFSETALLDCLKKPLGRSVFDQAMLWASKTERGLFWKSMQQIRSFSFGSGRSSQALARVQRNDEDEQWLSRLRRLGLEKDDEFKLLALKEFIWRLSQIKSRDSTDKDKEDFQSQLNNLIPLRSLGITPQTIIFDEPTEDVSRWNTDSRGADGKTYTIADALLDASTTIEDPLGKRKMAAINSHNSRVGGASAQTPTGTQATTGGGLLTPSRVPSGGEPADSSAAGSRRPSTLGQGKAPASQTDDDGSVIEEPSSGRRVVRHQSSAMSLLNRKDSNKSVPETGTTQANAFGEVEGPFVHGITRQALLEEDRRLSKAVGAKYKASHTYSGNDPNVLKMLDAFYIDNYPHDIAEFGPLVQPVTRRRAGATNMRAVEEAWKPSGKLVATFAEHTGAINRVVVSPDHVFFVTGGDDGCVKIWDTARLERNIVHRSRQTHRHGPGAKVTALCFIENTHCVISCANDGSVHVVKVSVAYPGGISQYGKLRLLREYQLPQENGEFAVWCDHFKLESNSVLVLATNRSRVLGIDLRTMTLLYVLENPVHHGTPTCFVVDRRRNWLLLGTSHGVLDLWDLRFKMRLKGWGVPGKMPIYRLAIHPIRGRSKWVCVSGGTGQGEVTVWDVEKTLCREVYRVAGSGSGSRDTGSKAYDPWDVDEDRPEGMLGRFATTIEPAAASTPTIAGADRGVRAMVVGTSGGGGDDGATGGSSSGRDVRHAFLLTGGADKRLRFWDLSRVELSCIYSGLAPDEPRPTCYASHPTTAITLNIERVPRSSSSAATAAAADSGRGVSGGSSPRPDKKRSAGNRSASVASSSSAATATAAAARPPRSSIISASQGQLLRSHLDSILDIALLESPYTMSVSVDRMGVVFVFQ